MKPSTARLMSTKQEPEAEHVHYHRDGSVWAKGRLQGATPTGYWEWFRRDGTKLRSGYFDRGKQVGEWTTYDKNGNVYKVTGMKPRIGKSRA